MASRIDPVHIVVPGSPHPDLAPNRRVHGLSKAKPTAQHRADAKHAALELIAREPRPIFTGPVAVTVRLLWGKGERRHDLDSCAVMVKPMLDGLTDAELWRDDRQMKQLTVSQDRDPARTGAVHIIVEEMR